MRLRVTSRVPCVLKAMWGVTISHIYPLIHAPWRMFVDGFDPDILHPMLSGQVLHYDAMQQYPFLDRNTAVVNISMRVML